MRSLILRRGVVIPAAVAAALTLSGHVMAQTPRLAKLTGLIHDYTPSLDALGPWHIVGDWTLALNTASGKVDFLASLSMVRSENATRMHHTHHLQLTGGLVTPLADGYRISGTASFTVNGTVAAFTGSPVDIEITGSTGVPYANIVIAIGGGAAAHFGPQIKGVVVTN